jgi:hypothetical protein
MDNLFSLSERLHELFFGISGLYLALHEKAQTIGWPKAIRGAFSGLIGCYLFAVIAIVAGNLLPLTSRQEQAAAVQPANVSAIAPARDGAQIAEKPFGVLAYGLALLFSPILYLAVRESWGGTNRKHQPKARR